MDRCIFLLKINKSVFSQDKALKSEEFKYCKCKIDQCYLYVNKQLNKLTLQILIS